MPASSDGFVGDKIRVLPAAFEFRPETVSSRFRQSTLRFLKNQIAYACFKSRLK
jgi:hypothetical protein